jgi:Predicted transcriptional regulator
LNERLRFLREKIGISRAAFGQKIGVSGDVINNLERGRVEIKEPILKLICFEFSVNENWIRNGTGDVFIKTPSSTIEKLRNEFHLDDFTCSFVYEYLKLDVEKRNAVQEFFYNVLNGINTVGISENGNKYITASETNSQSIRQDLPKTPEELESKYTPIEPNRKKSDTG